MNNSLRKGARKLLQTFPLWVPEALQIFMLTAWLSVVLSFCCVKNRNPNVMHISLLLRRILKKWVWSGRRERKREIKQIIAWNMLGNNFWCWDDVQKGKEMAGLIGRSTFTFFLPLISGRVITLYWLLFKNISFFFLPDPVTGDEDIQVTTRINMSCLLSFKEV